MKKSPAVFCLIGAAIAFFGAMNLACQNLETLIREVFAIPSPTGYENVLSSKIRGYLPQDWRVDKDNVGSLYAWPSAPAEAGLVVATALDEFGYFVSGIAADGYLRIDRAVTPPVAIFDSFLLGHVMSVTTKKGPLAALCSLPAMHIMPREMRDKLARGVMLDDIYLDIGVRSVEEAREKGVEILDAVTPWPDLAELEGKKWAGPSLAVKSGAAVLTALALDLRRRKPSADSALVWLAQTRFAARSQDVRGALGAVRLKNRLKPSQVVLIDTLAADREGGSVFIGKGPVLVLPREGASELGRKMEEAAASAKIPLQAAPAYESFLANPFLKDSKDVIILGLPVKFKATMSEVIDLKDVQALRDLLLQVLK